MYTLHYLPDACSLATHVVLNELQQAVNLVHRDQAENFLDLNPVGSVPVLQDNNQTLTEGAAIILFLLNKHPSYLFPKDEKAQAIAIQNIMFANATMHPAYNRLFFASSAIEDETQRQRVFEQAANAISSLWQVVENKLKHQTFLGGDNPSAADIMLAVYARWGAHFPVTIRLGAKTQQMIDLIYKMPGFQRAVSEQQTQTSAAKNK